MISVYLASVGFHLTRPLWSKVSSYSANPLTRDKETENASILLVTSSDLPLIPRHLLMWVEGWGSRGSQAGTQLGPQLGGKGCRARGIAFGRSPAAVAASRLSCPAPPPAPALSPRHCACPGPESQRCCNIKQTWHRERAACGTSPLAIFSCFSRETGLMQPASESRDSGYCPPPPQHLLAGVVAPEWFNDAMGEGMPMGLRHKHPTEPVPKPLAG